MEIGTGIAIGSTVIGSVAVIFKLFDYRKSCNGTGSAKVCAEHSGVVECLGNIQKGQERHEGWLQDIAKDVKELLKK
jgi:hypothetical protein